MHFLKRNSRDMAKDAEHRFHSIEEESRVSVFFALWNIP
jgi:hypothetical protein